MTERYDDRRVYWVWLSMLFGAGSSAFWKLCRGYDTVSGFAEELAGGRLDNKLTEAQRKKRTAPFSEAAELIARCESEGIKVLSYRSDGFPAWLRRIPEPPMILFLRGDARCLAPDRPSVLMIGTRTPTAGSVRTAERLAGELAERGVTVITGLENGIDAVSAESAAEKGTAAAVLGRGIFSDHYAPEQISKVSAGGAVLSEHTGFAEYGRVPFDRRNRLLCGLARALIFVECRSDSAGLGNVAHAAGKPIFALPPADIYDARYFGQRDLLRAGAQPVYSADDILSALSGRPAAAVSIDGIGRSKPRKKPNTAPGAAEKVTEARTITKNEQKNAGEGLHKSEMSATIDMSGFSEGQKKVWEALLSQERPVHVNKLTELTGLSIPDLMPELVELELDGFVTELSGKRYVRSK